MYNRDIQNMEVIRNGDFEEMLKLFQCVKSKKAD